MALVGPGGDVGADGLGEQRGGAPTGVEDGAVGAEVVEDGLLDACLGGGLVGHLVVVDVVAAAPDVVLAVGVVRAGVALVLGRRVGVEREPHRRLGRRRSRLLI